MMVMTSVSERPVTEPAGTIGALVWLGSAAARARARARLGMRRCAQARARAGAASAARSAAPL